ncbi:MAG: hypothetical protein K2L70_00740 [Clostridia bacterium]|nr:hypothetical protein [Clostridia bacterium]
MEDLSKNTTQQKSKTKLKLALLIVWMIICTAILIYFLVQNIIIIAAYTKEIADWNEPSKLENYDQLFINGVIQTCKDSILYSSTCLTFAILLYFSFLTLTIFKLIDLIKILRIEYRENIPPQ